MTEAEWLALPGALMIYHREKLSPVSPRKLRLLAVAYAKYLETQPEYADAMHVSHLGEEVVEGRASLDELWDDRVRSWGYDGNWAIANLVLAPDGVISTRIGLFMRVGGDPAVAEAATKRQSVVARPYILCVLNNPFRPVTLDPQWLTSTVVALARGIYDDRAFDRLPILADALQDAGCDNADVLNHCRDADPHARGCWVVDLVLGKS
jgi:hypothetical protein